MRQRLATCFGGRAFSVLSWVLSLALLVALVIPTPGNATPLGPHSQLVIGLPDGIADDPDNAPTPDYPDPLIMTAASFKLSLSVSLGTPASESTFADSNGVSQNQARAPPRART